MSTHTPFDDPNPLCEDMHVKLRLSGNLRKIELFHYIVGHMDPDYPFGPPEVRKEPSTSPRESECKACGGNFWKLPSVDREEMERLALQIAEYKGLPGHLKVKIKRLAPSKQCLHSNASTSSVEGVRHSDSTGLLTAGLA